jgi:hypothetical protein
MFGSRGPAMRIPGIIAGCIALATLLSGCDPNDRVYFRDGIGTDLYTTDIAAATDLQNAYLDSLCRQSLSYVGAVPSCSNRGELPPTLWPLIVQAGMNDIDTRCDSYLSWLDVKKRENGAILSEIGAIRVAVDALTNPAITTVSPVALAAVAAAFGLATSTLGNVNSLLLQVDHTTVQSIVFTQRQIFRENVLKLTSDINNKPTVIHALRTYLTICMPMTISAGINSTVTVFQQTGMFGRSFSPTTTIGSPFTPGSVVQKQTRAPPVPPADDVAPFFAETNLSKAETEFTLRGLCLDKNSGTGMARADLIKALIAIYEATPNPDNPPTSNGIISRNDRLVINRQSNCNAARNYFEKFVFANTESPAKTQNSSDTLASFVTNLLSRSAADGNVSGTSSLASPNLRDKIGAVRKDLGLNDVPPALSTQATPALVTALKNLKPKSN